LDLHRFAPDIILINSIWNDAKWIVKTHKKTNHLHKASKSTKKNPLIEPVNGIDALLGNGALYRKFRDFYWRHKLKIDKEKGIHEGMTTKEKNYPPDISLGLKQYRINMEGAVEVAEVVGAKPVLAIEERLIHRTNSDKEKEVIKYKMVKVNSHEELVSLFEQCDAILMDIARESDILLIDANAKIGKSKKYFTDHVHTTPEGSQFIADTYFKALKPMVLKIIEHQAAP